MLLFLSHGGLDRVEGVVASFCCGDGVTDVAGLCPVAEEEVLFAQSIDICGVSGEIL